MMKLLCLTILLAAILFAQGQGQGGGYGTGGRGMGGRRGMGGPGMGGPGMGGPGMRGHGMGGHGMGRHHNRHYGRRGNMDSGIVQCRVTCWDENLPEECDHLVGEERQICDGRVRENRFKCMEKCPEYDSDLMGRFEGPAL